MGSVIKLVFLVGFGYLVYLFWLEMIIAIVLMVGYLSYSISSVKRKIKTLKKEDIDVDKLDELAKRLFPYNRLARRLFFSLIDAHKKKEKQKSKDEADECLELFGMNPEDDVDEATIKKVWKKLAREYHPDKYQDETQKEQMHHKLSEINDCKDKLIKYYKGKIDG